MIRPRSLTSTTVPADDGKNSDSFDIVGTDDFIGEGNRNFNFCEKYLIPSPHVEWKIFVFVLTGNMLKNLWFLRK